ncbi:MAG: chemotaxis protein CheA [Spirochaetales bacterium]|nr:chemotaxis protein CheA [Spirochaetales bacterium]
MVDIDERKILEAFLEEVKELLETLNQRLLDLENSPEDSDVINEIFRLTHSIKSESALVGYKKISTLAHKMEDIFERVRRNVLLVNTEIMDALFAAFDRIMKCLSAVENGENEEDVDITDVVNPLLAILDEEAVPAASPTVKASDLPQPEEDNSQQGDGTVMHVSMSTLKSLDVEFSEIEKSQIEDAIEKGEKLYKVLFHIEDDCDMKYPRAYLVFNNFENTVTVLKTVPDIEKETDDAKFSEVALYILSSVSVEDLKDCADVDQIDRLDIKEINFGGSVGVDDLLSADEIQKAEELEQAWAEDLVKQRMEEQLAEDNKPQAAAAQKAPAAKAATKAPGAGEKIVQKQTIRVDTERLDELINLVGELIINRSRFMQISDKITDSSSIQELKAEIEDATSELERISDQMQMKMMQTRMVPVGTIFSKFPRMVRDLANSLHKNIHLEIIGENTEIDKTVIEHLAEPLTHLIRNSVDHGVESPDEREKKGKNREGHVILKAYQEGSNIYIEVEDDGNGLNIEGIKNKALENGIVTPAQLVGMPAQEIYDFIFAPGFSTKKEISSVSGRGVGMDVVKTELVKMRGRIDISTKLGEGTKFTIVLPLTTTIVEALLVNVDENIFAIPISVVEETLKINRSEIKEFDDYQVYNLRNETLAVIQLSDLVGMERVRKDDEDVYIVVVSFEKRRIGLIVNNLMGDQDIVIKGLDDVLKNNEGVAGAAVLGDGRIVLVLDTSTLVNATLKEINKLAHDYDLNGDGVDEAFTLSSLYDNLNRMESEKNDTEKTEDKKEVEPEVTDSSSNVKKEDPASDDENLKKITDMFNDIRE